MSQHYTVRATVASHGLHKGKPKTELDIPAMRSRHPLILYGMRPEDQGLLPLGEEVVVVLEAQKVKPTRAGEQPLDPTKSWSWFWNFVRVATPEDGDPVDPVVMPVPGAGNGSQQQRAQAPAAAPAQSTAATGREHRGGGGADPVGVSIMAQVALKAAVESLAYVDSAYLREQGAGVDATTIVFADRYLRWMLKASGHAVPQAPEAPRNGNRVQGHQEGSGDQGEAPSGPGHDPTEQFPDDDPALQLPLAELYFLSEQEDPEGTNPCLFIEAKKAPKKGEAFRVQMEAGGPDVVRKVESVLRKEGPGFVCLMLPEEKPRGRQREEPVPEQGGVVDHYGDTEALAKNDHLHETPEGVDESDPDWLHEDAPPEEERRKVMADAHRFDQRDGQIPPLGNGDVPGFGAMTREEVQPGDLLEIQTRSRDKSWPGVVHSFVRTVRFRDGNRWIYTYEKPGENA